MISKSIFAAALLVCVASASAAGGFNFTYGSARCVPGTKANCKAAAKALPATEFLLAGQSLADLDALNENVSLIGNPIIPARSFINRG